MRISHSSYNEHSGKASDSFKRTGLKYGVCRLCGHKVAWNAYAMGAHLKGKKHQAAKAEIKVAERDLRQIAGTIHEVMSNIVSTPPKRTDG